MTKDAQRFVEEIRKEFASALEMIQARLIVDNPKETFAISNVIGALNIIALDYSMKAGLPAPSFIAALRGMARQLEIEMETKTGVFAPKS